ncbi:HvfC/BufC family peptide modification chaperone [Sphingomonas oryzagri]
MSLLALQQGFRDWLTTESDAVAARCAGPAGAGLSIYLNNYRGQLMACLRESYGTLHAWLGDGPFEAAAATHIDRVPPSSWTLDDYALDFPDTLIALYPGDPEVGELARLERALTAAFISSDRRPIDPAALADIDWDETAFRFTPSLALLLARTNAAAIWSAIARGATPPPAQMLQETAVTMVWRSGLTPVFRTVDTIDAEALAIVLKGEGFSTLCALLIEQLGETDGLAKAGTCLAQWIADEIIVDIGVRRET